MLNVIEGIGIGVGVGILTYFGWLIKRSLYGDLERERKRIDDLEKTFDEFKEGCIMDKDCIKNQTSCNKLVALSLDNLSNLIKEAMERQTQLMIRIDHHINQFPKITKGGSDARET